mmetsp:Transcript_53044/g.119519  ORF Transcript_53044/g.119519 Transcript_53044/m.119519 type:complete len:243 (-) Transcript_53044:82-810(-)
MDDAAVTRMVLQNSDGEALKYESHRMVDPSRQQVMATAFPQCDLKKKAVAVLATGADGAKRELIAMVTEGDPAAAPELVMGSCSITYEDLSPSECIEYAFAEAPEEWAMAQLSLEALETYRGMKFEAWKAMLLSPTCEAQFRRMLQIGVVSQLYDPHVFPTPESTKSKFQVTDERTGKLIELPHPVHELRVWDVEKQAYKLIDTQLKGAPSEAEKDDWWINFVKELDATHGHEYIAGLMAGK